MPAKTARIGWSSLATALLIVAGIVYGSLYPFEFHNPAVANPWLALLSSRATSPGRYDVIANIVFYLPFGYFLLRSFDRLPAAVKGPLVVFCGAALSSSMELLQYYDAGRQPSIWDVASNTAGTLAGVLAGAFFARRSRTRDLKIQLGAHPLVSLLLFCWVGFRLFPYVPVIDVHKYWRSVEPLLISPVSAGNTFRHLALWLAVALLLEAEFGRRARVAIIVAYGFVLGARVGIDGIRLSPDEVAGAALAAVLWCFWLSRLRWRAAVVLGLFSASIAIAALAPVAFERGGGQLQWIPFLSLVSASFYVTVPLFFEKVFTGGTLVWLMLRSGLPWRAAAILGAGFILAVSLAQSCIPGRSGDLTDVALLGVLLVAIRLMPEHYLADPEPA